MCSCTGTSELGEGSGWEQWNFGDYREKNILSIQCVTLTSCILLVWVADGFYSYMSVPYHLFRVFAKKPSRFLLVNGRWGFKTAESLSWERDFQKLRWESAITTGCFVQSDYLLSSRVCPRIALSWSCLLDADLTWKLELCVRFNQCSSNKSNKPYATLSLRAAGSLLLLRLLVLSCVQCHCYGSCFTLMLRQDI